MAKISATVTGTSGAIAVEIEDRDRTVEDLSPQLYLILHMLDPNAFPVSATHTD